MKFTMKLQIHFQSLKKTQNHTVFALFAGSVKNQGDQKRSRKATSLKSPSCSTSVQRSIFVQSEKISTRSSSSNSETPNFHQKTVGVVGGGSVVSTMRFLEKLVEHGEGKDVGFIVSSDPCLRYSNGGEDIDIDPLNLMIEKVRKKRVFVEEGGAGCIVMPCHVFHIWFDEISDGCSVPFLNVAECVALELKEAHYLKPIEAGSNVRIGVIARDTVLMAGFYQDKLKKQGFEVVLPDKASMERIVKPAMNAVKRKDIEGAQNLLRIAIQMLLVRAVNVVVLACDELHSLLPPDDPLLKHCLDPFDVLARSAVRT